MRLFIAAELPDKVIEALSETSALLRGAVRGRYVAPDSFHVTLAFLGEVDAGCADLAIEALEEGCRGLKASRVALGELGSFGRRAKATLWQGFADAGVLPDAAGAIRAELKSLGFEIDGKSFIPHVTLMRAADLSSGVLPAPVRRSGAIENITLFRSDLSGDRPVYEPVHSVRLLTVE